MREIQEDTEVGGIGLAVGVPGGALPGLVVGIFLGLTISRSVREDD